MQKRHCILLLLHERVIIVIQAGLCKCDIILIYKHIIIVKQMRYNINIQVCCYYYAGCTLSPSAFDEILE